MLREIQVQINGILVRSILTHLILGQVQYPKTIIYSLIACCIATPVPAAAPGAADGTSADTVAAQKADAVKLFGKRRDRQEGLVSNCAGFNAT